MNGHSMRSARRYELRGKTTCQPTGPLATRRASRSKTPNKLKELKELEEMKEFRELKDLKELNELKELNKFLV